ncbi:hypothetical protein QR680_004540 [Steinernema hermaphroditum]|uniref:Uncharacterized protein n=1 Tax=Steinernema hermaphroditum TaxID=289476 RepID=A0AA39LTC8_9BILA|nr:hypothetical protein QR680_004540 [Steinernema hermaphroditum]
MEAKLRECAQLDTRNEQLLRRIEEVKAEIRESRRKIEDVKSDTGILEMTMEANEREMRALMKQKDASIVCVELNTKTLDLAKEKLARLVVSNEKVANDNANHGSEWRSHIEHSEKVLAQLRSIYESAPWIADAESSKSNIEVAKKEADKLWEALRSSFESSVGDASDEDSFMQQMTIIRRLGNKILRNNREWAKLFKVIPKPKRQLLDADALLNDSLADLGEDEEEETPTAADHNNHSSNRKAVNLVQYTEDLPTKRRNEEFLVPEVPKKMARLEGDVVAKSPHVTFANPAFTHCQFYSPQESYVESVDRPERSERSSSSGEQMIFDCTADEQDCAHNRSNENIFEKPNPRELQESFGEDLPGTMEPAAASTAMTPSQPDVEVLPPKTPARRVSCRLAGTPARTPTQPVVERRSSQTPSKRASQRRVDAPTRAEPLNETEVEAENLFECEKRKESEGRHGEGRRNSPHATPTPAPESPVMTPSQPVETLPPKTPARSKSGSQRRADTAARANMHPASRTPSKSASQRSADAPAEVATQPSTESLAADTPVECAPEHLAGTPNEEPLTLGGADTANGAFMMFGDASDGNKSGDSNNAFGGFNFESSSQNNAEPSFLAGIAADKNSTQEALDFNFGIDGNDSQADDGIFNFNFGNDDNTDGNNNNDFQFNFGGDDGTEDAVGGNAFNFNF